jgi:hypothetical protein
MQDRIEGLPKQWQPPFECNLAAGLWIKHHNILVVTAAVQTII